MASGVGKARPNGPSARRRRARRGSRRARATMRTVADQVQFVVQIVFTTSSKTVGLRIIRPGARRHPREVRIGRGGLVERAQVLVEAQDVRDGRGAALGDRRARAPAEHLDLRVPLRPSETRTVVGRLAVERQRQLERPRLLVDPVRRQVGDAVRGDRPPKVDRLAARADGARSRSCVRHLSLQRRFAPRTFAHVGILGVDVGGTFTDAVLVEDGRIATAKVPTAARQEESVLAAARAVGATRRRALHARDDRRDERAARAQGRAHGVRRDRRVRASAPPAPPGARSPLPALRATIPSRSSRSSAASASTSGSGRTACCGRSTSSRCPRSTPRRSPSACSSRSATRATSARSSPRSCGGGCPERTSSPRTRSRRSSASTSARRRRRSTRTSGRRSRATSRRSRRAAPRRACPSRSSCARPAASRRSRRRRRIPPFALLSGPAAGVVGAALAAARGRDRERDLARHGRDVDRRRADQGRRGRARVGARRRRIPGPAARASTCRPSAPAAARSPGVDAGGALRVGPESAGADPGPACYGRGGTRPTVTDANLVLGRLPEHARRRARRSTARPPSGRSATSTRRPSIAAVNAEMLRALRSSRSSADTIRASFALVAFGGAGPLHACELAEELEIETVLVPGARRRAVGARPRGERRAARPRPLVPRPARRGGRAAGARARRISATRASRSS